MPLCTLNSLTNLMNFSFSLSRLNTFPWWCAMDMMSFFFVRIISSYCFMTSAAYSGFSTFSAFSFNYVSITLLVVMESISSFFISSLVSRFVLLVFSQPPHSYKQKLLYHKSKTSFTNKKMRNLFLRSSATTLSKKTYPSLHDCGL